MWKVASVLLHCGVNPRATSWLCTFRLGHSPLHVDYKHYRLCSCGLFKTKTNQSFSSGYVKFYWKYSFQRTGVHVISTKRTQSSYMESHSLIWPRWTKTRFLFAIIWCRLQLSFNSFGVVAMIRSHFLRWERNFLSLMFYKLFASLFINVTSFASLFINILPSYYRTVTGIGRWHSRLWPVVVCPKIK